MKVDDQEVDGPHDENWAVFSTRRSKGLKLDLRNILALKFYHRDRPLLVKWTSFLAYDRPH